MEVAAAFGGGGAYLFSSPRILALTAAATAFYARKERGKESEIEFPMSQRKEEETGKEEEEEAPSDKVEFRPLPIAGGKQ